MSIKVTGPFAPKNDAFDGIVSSKDVAKTVDSRTAATATPTSGDEFLFFDASDSNAPKLCDFDKLGSLPIDSYTFGFVTQYDGSQYTTISFDGTTFTLTDSGAGWSYYRNGVKYSITGNKTIDITAQGGYSAGTTQLWYIYIDGTDGALTASETGWTLEDTKVPVATVTTNSSLTPAYAMSNERHTCAIDRRFHWEHHFSDGTEIITASALVAGSYSVTPASPTTANNTIAFGAGVAADEDLKITVNAIANPSPDDGSTTPYQILYRTADTGAASDWSWELSAVPYRYTAAGYIQYDNAGTMTQGATQKFYNTYVLMTNMDADADGVAELVFISGNGQFDTLAAAQSEKFSDLDIGGIPINEFVAVYQLTWQASAAYTGALGKCRLAHEPEAISVSASGVSAGVSQDHSLLTHRDWDTAAHTPGATEKASPVSADLIPIWDSEASNAPKYVQAGNLSGGSTIVYTDYRRLSANPTIKNISNDIRVTPLGDTRIRAWKTVVARLTPNGDTRIAAVPSPYTANTRRTYGEKEI